MLNQSLLDKAIDIILPCYNPMQGWEQRIMNADLQLKAATKTTIRWIIVDDGSKESPEPAIQKLTSANIELLFVSHGINKGKGQALRSGLGNAKAPYIIYTDIDLPYTLDSMVAVINALEEFDVVIGTRNKSYHNKIPKGRLLVSKLVMLVNRVIMRLPTSDTQGGLKGLRSSAVPHFLNTTINRYLIDIDFIKRVHRDPTLKIGMQEVSTIEHYATSNVSPTVLLRELKDYIRLLFNI